MASSVIESLRRAGTILGRFAVVRLWPGRAAAEHEVVERLRRAAAKIGVEVVEVDSIGVLQDGSGQKVLQQDVDFVFHPHFSTAKNYDCFSYAALWNPVDWYYMFGYEQVLANQASHDHYASLGVQASDDMLLRVRSGEFKSADFPLVHNSLAEPILPPQRMTGRKAFYCGINWERAAHQPVRHGPLLQYLDRHTDVLEIYGPERIEDMRPWAGFGSYRGELPFDGVSVVYRAAACGIVLVLSSRAHRSSGVMSNRIFECLASGSLILADPHPFIVKNFGDCAGIIDDKQPIEIQARQVTHFISWANENPDAALEFARAGQARFLDRYAMDRQLEALYRHYVATVTRDRERSATARGRHKLSVCVVPFSSDPDLLARTLASLARQTSDDFEVALAVRSKDTGAIDIPAPLEERLTKVPVGSLLDAPVGNFGPIAARLIDRTSGDVCTLSIGMETFFSTYVETATRAVVPGRAVRFAGLLEHALSGIRSVDVHDMDSNPMHVALSATLVFGRAAYDAAAPMLDYLGLQAWLALADDGLAGTLHKHYVPQLAVALERALVVINQDNTHPPLLAHAHQSRMVSFFRKARMGMAR